MRSSCRDIVFYVATLGHGAVLQQGGTLVRQRRARDRDILLRQRFLCRKRLDTYNGNKKKKDPRDMGRYIDNWPFFNFISKNFKKKRTS